MNFDKDILIIENDENFKGEVNNYYKKEILM